MYARRCPARGGRGGMGEGIGGMDGPLDSRELHEPAGINGRLAPRKQSRINERYTGARDNLDERSSLVSVPSDDRVKIRSGIH